MIWDGPPSTFTVDPSKLNFTRVPLFFFPRRAGALSGGGIKCHAIGEDVKSDPRKFSHVTRQGRRGKSRKLLQGGVAQLFWFCRERKADGVPWMKRHLITSASAGRAGWRHAAALLPAAGTGSSSRTDRRPVRREVPPSVPGWANFFCPVGPDGF